MEKIKQGYKQTDIGVIPEDWSFLELKEYFSFISYGFTNPMPIVSDGIYLVTANDIKNGQINFQTARKTTEVAYNFYLTDKSRPKRNDVLLTKDGTLGRLAIVGDEKICINQSVAIIRPNHKINPQFLKLLLEGEYYQKTMIENAGGSTIKHIYITIVDKMQIAVPLKITEQTAIATALSDTDALIAALDKKIAKKQQIKQGAMQQLLTGKKRLPGFSGEWVEKEFKDFCWFQEGPGLRNWQFTNSGIKVINVTNLEKGVLNLSNTDRYISLDEFHLIYEHFEIDENDIVVASSGNSYGKSAIVRKKDLPLLMNTSVIRFKPKKGLDYHFLWVFLNSDGFKKQIDLLITGGAQPNFGPAHLNKLKIFMPEDVTEQYLIAQILTDMDNEIAQLEKERDKYKELKAGMMQVLLTGKVRLV